MLTLLTLALLAVFVVFMAFAIGIKARMDEIEERVDEMEEGHAIKETLGHNPFTCDICKWCPEWFAVGKTMAKSWPHGQKVMEK